MPPNPKSKPKKAGGKGADGKPRGKGGFKSSKRPAAPPANEGPANKKRRLKQERRSAKPHADVVGRVLSLWNDLREKTVAQETREQLIGEVVAAMQGRYHGMCLKHDTSRAVQAVVMWGSEAQVDGVVAEVEPGIAELSQSPYAHFVVFKLIKRVAVQKTEGPRKRLVRALRGCMSRLAVHSVGARVVETALAELPKADSRALRQELFGREHVLATASTGERKRGDEGAHTLRGLLTLRPDRREVILTKLWALLQKMVDKQLCQFVYVQELLCEYLECAGPAQVAKAAPALAEHAIMLLTSREGARAAALVAAYGGARERKRMTKALKGHVKATLHHRDAYIALLKLVDVTDDTVSTKKNILPEIFEVAEQQYTATGEENAAEFTTEALATSAPTAQFFLWLLAPDNKRYFHEMDMKALMAPSQLPPPGAEEIPLSVDPDSVDTSAWVSTSKKEPEQRRRELLSYLRQPLIDLCAEHAAVMLRRPYGSKLLFEVARRWRPAAVHARIVEELTKEPEGAAEEDEGEEEAKPTLPLWEDPKGHLTVKWLFISEAKDDEDGEGEEGSSLAADFTADLNDELLLKYMGCNRGCFVIEALVKVPAVRAGVIKRVKRVLKATPQLKARMKTSKGLQAINAEANRAEA